MLWRPISCSALEEVGKRRLRVGDTAALFVEKLWLDLYGSLRDQIAVETPIGDRVVARPCVDITKDTYGHLREPAFRAAADAMEEALWG